MNILEFDNRLEAILVRWDNVEASIKSAELFQGKVTVPAINELRYAGRQIIRAISQSRNLADRDVYDKALYNAEQCLTNADHDIADSLVMFIGRRIDDLNARFGGLSIERAYPPYRELRSAIRECQKRLNKPEKIAKNGTSYMSH
ncbi:hypothetical protein ACFQE0_08285 [Methylobacterium komagatae]|uniref:Uncharacterized protein n=1 Tax=Methylobacterium komagatae TaxID=374425 RepID=A0ABW2BGU2_9HYPH